MQGEVLTIDLLNKLFNPQHPEVIEKFCPKCKGLGIWNQLEDSKFGYGGKVLMWYRCACQVKQEDRLNGR